MKRYSALHTSVRMKRQNKGFALIYTLWTVVILSGILAALGMNVRSSLRFAAYNEESIYADINARSGLHRMASEIVPKKNLGQGDSLADMDKAVYGFWLIDTADWTVRNIKADKGEDAEKQLSDGLILCEVTAEDGKYPLKSLDAKQTDKIKVLDNLDRERLKQYLARQKTEGNYSFYGMILEGAADYTAYVGDEENKGLREILTEFSSDGKINLNSAGKDALSLLPGVDEDTAAAIEEAARKQPFSKPEEIKHVLGVTPKIFRAVRDRVKTASDIYRIKSLASVGGIKSGAEAVFIISKTESVIIYMTGG